MDFGQHFILGIIAITTAGGIARTWVMARHGVSDDGDRPDRQQRRIGRWQERQARHMARWAPWAGMQGGWGSPVAAGDLEADRKVQLLAQENEKLTGQVSRLEERLRVLERIATDPAERTAREIDALRDR